MINLLIVLAGLAILIVTLAVGIVMPLGRAAPGRRDAPPVPAAHVVRGVVGAVIGALILQAEQAVAQAQGQADSTVALANGQATTNKALAASLSDQILQYQYIQKLTDKITVMLVPSGNASIFDLKGLLNQSMPSASPAP